jgi:mRNA-degrading endonuclease RelE of RelBE toxin-antitoxin system
MKVSVNVADESAIKKLKRLENSTSENRLLLENLNRAFDQLQIDPYCGIHIPKKLIPPAYFKKYQPKNLWKYDLSGGWRLLYFIVNDEDETIVVIIDWMTHKEYERLFNYG